MVEAPSSQNGVTPRRTSSRLKKIEAKTSIPQKREAPVSNTVRRTKKKMEEQSPRPDQKSQVVEDNLQQVVSQKVVSIPVSEGNEYAKVTETLRMFNKHYLHFIQVEEKRCATKEVDNKGEKSNKTSKKMGKTEDCSKKPSKRPDLKAISEMIKLGAILYDDKRIGHIPGIDVGHQFFSRAEMVVVGFHQHWLNGINFIGQSTKQSRKKTSAEQRHVSSARIFVDGLRPASSILGSEDYKFPLTVSIVLSGQYEDDLDNCDEIVYTGQGGNNLLGDKRQYKDQVMERGNLGLKNSMEQSVPVRVVRGHKCQNSYVGKVYTYDGLYKVRKGTVYTYDGLYKVVKYWAEKGVSGFTVYKFRLRRLGGQPPLTTDQVHFTRGRIPKSPSELRGLVCQDITGGLEDIPIPVTNLVDNPPISPLEGFVYIKDMKFSMNTRVRTVAPSGCNCRGKCVDPRSCACAKLNGGDFPYVHCGGGRLVEPKAVVFECGPNCGCGPECVNRSSQKVPRYHLEIFRTPNKGWGVRSWDNIPSGAPICEYIGLLKRTDDLDPAADNSYVFDIDCLQTMKGLDGRESRLRDVSLPAHLQKVGQEVSESVPFCIDAGQTGNLARFINHSCQPNLFVQCMLSNHHDMKLARIILVAADNIPPLKELTYDYGYALDSVMDPDGKIRQMPCYCGAQGCRKRLY